jgi:hypothetical protein
MNKCSTRERWLIAQTIVLAARAASSAYEGDEICNEQGALEEIYNFINDNISKNQLENLLCICDSAITLKKAESVK